MFAAIDAAKPGFLVVAGTRARACAWFISTVLLPRSASTCGRTPSRSIYTARRTRSVFRRNAIVLPLYQLILLFVFFVGFAAMLQVPGLTGADIDLALFKLSVQTSRPGSSA